jgi:hypothetical protein
MNIDTNVKEKNDNLIKEVRKLLFKRNLVLFLMFLFVPIVGVTDYLFGLDKLTLIVAILFFIIIGWQLFVVNFSKCPRCHKFFFWTKFWANIFSSKCMNCGLGGK